MTTPDVLGFTESIIKLASQHDQDAHASDHEVVTEPDPQGDRWYINEHGFFVHPSICNMPTRRTQGLALVRRGVSLDYQRLQHVEGAVWHWTDTPRGTGHVIAHGWATSSAPRSAHGIIDGDGTYYQCAPLTVGTWHAGGPSAKRWVWDAVKMRWVVDATGHSPFTANSIFAGFELVNVGEVRFVQGRGWLGWPFGDAAKEAASGRSAVVPEDQVVEWYGWDRKTKRHYHAFTDAQIATATNIVRALRRDLGLPADSLLHTHHECDPDRRDDPGRYWIDVVMPRVLAGSLP